MTAHSNFNENEPANEDIQHNQQTEVSMLRCRLASVWSEIVKNMSYSDFISYCLLILFTIAR